MFPYMHLTKCVNNVRDNYLRTSKLEDTIRASCNELLN